MANENIEVGTRAVAKVGRNEISVEVIAVENGSFLVRNDAGREFHVVHLTLPDEDAFCEENDAPNPAPECAVNRPEKKLSLFEAVVAALQGEEAGTAPQKLKNRQLRFCLFSTSLQKQATFPNAICTTPTIWALA